MKSFRISSLLTLLASILLLVTPLALYLMDKPLLHIVLLEVWHLLIWFISAIVSGKTEVIE